MMCDHRTSTLADVLLSMGIAPSPVWDLDIFRGRVQYAAEYAGSPGVAPDTVLSGSSGTFADDLLGAVAGWFTAGDDIVIAVESMEVDLIPDTGVTPSAAAVAVADVLSGSYVQYRKQGKPSNRWDFSPSLRILPDLTWSEAAASDLAFASLRTPRVPRQVFDGLVVDNRADDWRVVWGPMTALDSPGTLVTTFNVTAVKRGDWLAVRPELSRVAVAMEANRSHGLPGAVFLDKLRTAAIGSRG